MRDGTRRRRSASATAAPALVIAALATALLPARPAAADDPFLRRTATVRAVEKVGPAVVNITTEQRSQQPSPFRPFFSEPAFDRFFRDFFEPRSPRTSQSLGSGVVIDGQGHVLTNEHVVAAAERIRVSLADGREFEAELVGADPNNDLAVLRLQTDEHVPWTPPGAADDLMVGEPVIAIGNPFGLSNTVTTGVLSAVDRSIRAGDRVYHGFLQTDASINPGNSGGPLLNANGELIGVNTAIYQGAEGIGFAIPIDVAMRVVRELITHGSLAPVWLGLEVQDVDERLAAVLDLPPQLGGALVTEVKSDGAASRAGVHRGDVLVAVDGHAVRTAREYFEMLDRATPGQELRLTLRRDGLERELRALAESFPASEVAALAERLLGMDLEPDARGVYRVTRVRAGGGAARIGVEPGDLVLALNGTPLDAADAFQHAVLGLRGHPRALVVVQRGRGRYHVTIPLGS